MNPESEGVTMQPDSTNTTASLLPPQCPRFLTCSAALCPIDPVWRTTVHLPGEKVCFYLLASGKVGAAERFQDDPVFAAVLEQLPEITARHARIGWEVERAARKGFRKNNLPVANPATGVSGEGEEVGNDLPAA